jgi:hypothetical protein
MNFKIHTLAGVTLSILAIFVVPQSISQAQSSCGSWTRWVCNRLTAMGGRPSSIIPADLIAGLEEKITLNQATTVDYILLGYSYAQVNNYSMSETRFNEGLELARNERSLDLQAGALEGLGQTLAATGNTPAATSRLTEAGTLYRELRDWQNVTEVNRQLIRLRRYPGRYPVILPDRRL